MSGRTVWWRFAIGALVLVILLPTLALPLGPDSSMFFVSAQKIVSQGAAHYRDIVDVKPPLIYHLYALAIRVLGESPPSVRIVDLLLQLATCGALALLVRRCGGGRGWAAATAVIYAMLYGSLGYAYTMQVESYIGLPIAATAWLVLARRTPMALVAAGAVAGVATLLKFPFAVMIGVVVLAEAIVIAPGARTLLRHALLAVAGFVAVMAIAAIVLVATDAWRGFAEVSAFIAGYARTKTRGPGALAAEVLRDLPAKVSAVLGTTVLLATIGASVLSIGGIMRIGGRALELLQVMIITVGLLAVSLVIEGKFYPYQLSRLAAPVAVAAAFGLVVLARRLRRARGAHGRVGALVVATLVALFSPIGSWLWFSVTPAAALVARDEAAYDAYFDRMAVYYPRTELRLLGERVRATARPGDELLTLSSIGALVHHFTGIMPRHRIYHSAFLLAEFAPRAWRDEVRRYAIERTPAFIVVQRGDVLLELTGNERSSDALIGVLKLDGLLSSAYTTILVTERFTVYQRLR